MPRNVIQPVVLRHDQVLTFVSSRTGLHTIAHFHDDGCPMLTGKGACRCDVAIGVYDHRGTLVAMAPAHPDRTPHRN